MEKKILKSLLKYVVGWGGRGSSDQNTDLRYLEGKQANCSRNTGIAACRVGGGGGWVATTVKLTEMNHSLHQAFPWKLSL